MAKLELFHVGYVYNPGTEFSSVALEDVSVSFEEHAVTGIIGHTGSGKSTLLQLLNGLLKPTTGQVLLDGQDIHETVKAKLAREMEKAEAEGLRISKRQKKKEIRAELDELRKTLCFRVGLVMQYPEYQLFEETVRKDIAFGPKNMGLSEEEINARIAKVAGIVGLTERHLNKSPFDLSGGQKRRAAIAGVLAMEPEVLVLDEPAAGLDPSGRTSIFQSILEYRKETNATVLIVSHSMEDMAAYCDRVLVMNRGRVFMQGSCRDVFEQSGELEKTGLDVPQVTHLIDLLRSSGVDLPQGIFTVDDAVSAIASRLREGGCS